MEYRHGFIHEPFDIKILILFVLSRVRQPMTMNDLAEISWLDNGISYFDFAQCVGELVETGNLTQDLENYDISEKGVRNSEITETGIPYTVRVKAEKCARELRSKLMRQTLVRSSRELRRGGGYDVTLYLSDGIGDVMTATLFAPDEKNATLIEKGFNKNAEKIYSDFIEALTAAGRDDKTDKDSE